MKDYRSLLSRSGSAGASPATKTEQARRLRYLHFECALSIEITSRRYFGSLFFDSSIFLSHFSAALLTSSFIMPSFFISPAIGSFFFIGFADGCCARVV